MSELKRDEETGHLVGIEQKPVPTVPHADFPKWKFRVVDKQEDGKPDHKILEAIVVDNADEEGDIGSDWSDSRAEVVKGTELEHVRTHEHVVHKHHVIKKEEPVAESEEIVEE